MLVSGLSLQSGRDVLKCTLCGLGSTFFYFSIPVKLFLHTCPRRCTVLELRDILVQYQVQHREQGLGRLSDASGLVLMVESGQPSASKCQTYCLSTTPDLLYLKVPKSEKVNSCPSNSYCSLSL